MSAPTPRAGATGEDPRPIGAAATRPGGRLDGPRLRGLILTNVGASVAFTAMYATQPVLPQIGHDFRIGPAEAGLTLLAVTFALALASLGAGRLADRLGPRRLMVTCSAALALLSAAAALAPTFWLLVAIRAAQGLMVPGVTVAGLAYLHNALPAAWRGRISGFYIATNTLGGLLGRLGVGLTVAAITWRGGLALVALAGAAGTLAILVGVPRAPARAAPPGDSPGVAAGPAARGPGPLALGRVVRRRWGAPLIGGTVFFPFLTVFTYVPYRLEGPPFRLPPTVSTLIYLVYLLGAVASVLAGQLSDRFGRRPTILLGLLICASGLALSAVDVLPLVAAAVALVGAGGLMAHVVANASVSDGANPLGARARATALALYTAGFYVGGGLGAVVPGYGWERWGWPGVLAPCAVAVAGAALCSLRTPWRPAARGRADPAPVDPAPAG